MGNVRGILALLLPLEHCARVKLHFNEQCDERHRWFLVHSFECTQMLLQHIVKTAEFSSTVILEIWQFNYSSHMCLMNQARTVVLLLKTLHSFFILFARARQAFYDVLSRTVFQCLS